MSLISVSNLTFAYEGSYDAVFSDVSFQLDSDWRLGFIGRNGRGKTTFLQLLMGKYSYEGQIWSSEQFSYFPFSVEDATQTILEIAEQLVPNRAAWELLRELSLLEVSEDAIYRPFYTLSSGEQTKALLAILFLQENSFALIDEPTNHLDIHARALVSQYLKSKKGFILVSHDRIFLDGCIDHVLSINRTSIALQKGNFSSWWQNKQNEDQRALSENQKLKGDIARLSEAAKRTSSWSDQLEKTKYASKNSGLRPPDRGFIGHKSAKMMKRAKAIEKRQQDAMTQKEDLLNNLEASAPLKISPQQYHAQRLIELSFVSLFYGQKKVCDEISFSVEQGDRIALSGANGSGKSSLLKLICGQELAYTGNLQRGGGVVLSYLPQDASFLSGRLTDFTDYHKLNESLFKTILRKMDFARVQFEKDMADFSAGQKKKVLLAKSLCEKAHLYIWDEPLNYIDLLSRLQLEELLLEYQPTMIFVEHDRTFVDKLATKKIMLGTRE